MRPQHARIGLPVLLLVTFRPEFDPPWLGRPYVTALTINRLAEREVGAMIDGVIGNKLLPANIRQDIIERTDGIPLFVEEMPGRCWRQRTKKPPSAQLQPFRRQALPSPGEVDRRPFEVADLRGAEAVAVGD